MSTKETATAFFDALRANRDLFDAWKVLPKSEESISAFISRVTMSSVGADDLRAIQTHIDEDLRLHANDLFNKEGLMPGSVGILVAVMHGIKESVAA